MGSGGDLRRVLLARSVVLPRLFQQQPAISLVLADHMLSGKTGTQLAAQIKQIKRTVPVVMHSGRSPVSMSNIDGFIDKGEPPATLVDFIAELVRRFWT
jgi:CheY-like chemotaxis protein